MLIPALHAAGGDEETRELDTRCRVALLGFGTVGSAVARRLTSGPHAISSSHTFSTAARSRSAHALRGRRASPGRTRIDDVLQSDAHVVVEAIGGVEPAADWIRAALLAASRS